MKIERIDYEFSICRVEDFSHVDISGKYCFTAGTDEENSLVCPKENVPDNTVERDDGWRAFRIQGVLDFSLVGILSKLSALLAAKGIGIFAVSTYNTDYIFVKSENYPSALEALAEAGYEIV